MSSRSHVLAERLERGAAALATLAEGLTDAEWARPVPGDGRPVGVVVHHVADVYPLEMELATRLARSEPVTGVGGSDVHAMNARHAAAHAGVTKVEALAHLRTRSAAAARAVRALRDEDLDGGAPVSLYGDAPLSCQFFLEDHAVRHAWHHLARLRAAVGR